MGAKEANITAAEAWFKGEDRTINIDVDQADGTTPQNMTGWALTWELMSANSGPAVLTKTTALGGIAITNGDGTNDRAAVTILDTDTEPTTLPAGVYYYRLRRTDAGNETVLAYGTAVLMASGFS